MNNYNKISPQKEDIFDKDMIMSSLDNDVELYTLIAEEFCNSKNKRQNLINLALNQNKIGDLERELHTLKGLFYTFGAKGLGEKAKTIELNIKNLNISLEEIKKNIEVILMLDNQLVQALKEDLKI